MRLFLALFLSGVIPLLHLPLFAQVRDVTHDFGLSAGFQHDSNLVFENETNTTQSDNAILLGGDAEINARFDKNIRLNANYFFSQSLHQEFNDFNLQTHVVRAGGDYDKNKSSVGTHLTLINARLDGSSYLNIQQFSPSFGHLFNAKFYSRSALSIGNKTLQGEGRNAKQWEANSDLYYFQRGTKEYWVGGLAVKRENAEADEFDYRSLEIKGSWIRKFTLLEKATKARVKLRAGQRKYQDSARNETRLRLQASLSITIDRHIELMPFYEFGDYQSDFSEFDYSQHIIGVDARYDF